MAEEAEIRVQADALRDLVQRILEFYSVPPDEAFTVADVLVRGDLRGVHSHGVARLEQYYVGRLRKGLVEPKAKAVIVRETPATALIDGGNSLGAVVSKYAMEVCLKKAQEVGVGVVAVKNSNHFGIAGYYAMMALPLGMIGIALTNASPRVAPTYGRAAMFGTNPIAIAVPAGEERPFVLDMATSVAPLGKIEVHERHGLPLPMGWAIDKEGRPTTDPKAFRDGGALLPLGGFAETAGYKGYGLAIAVDILCGILPGAGACLGVLSSLPTQEKPTNIGHFFAALRIDLFRDPGEFRAAMDDTIRSLKDSPKAPGEERIYIAGEKEFEKEEEYRRTGIPFLPVVINMLKRLAAEANVEWNLGC